VFKYVYCIIIKCCDKYPLGASIPSLAGLILDKNIFLGFSLLLVLSNKASSLTISITVPTISFSAI